MKLGVTLDILNQKDTPAFYADTLANRPAAGFTGRVFISTDTLDLYRDTGTTWVLLSPSSTGTITGAGAAGQVTYFSGTSSITGDNNLFWDSVNGHLGIKTITPDCALDVNHAGTFVAKFNNTTTANTLIGIYNLDNPQWLIGSNSVANDLTFYDATNFPTLVATTTMKTNGTTFIGGQTTGSGRLNVYSATGDNGIQISGPTAPSLRIDNAPTGPTKRIGLGIATAVNNFIQGAVDRDMCIFNGSTTASPMLFGIYDTTNVQEAARISAARNFIIGSTTDTGNRFQCVGSALITGATTISNSLTINSLLVGGSTSFTKAYIADTLPATTIGTNYNPGILNLQNLSATNGNLSLIGFQDASAFINLAAFGAINEVHSGSPNSVVGSLAFYTKPSGSGYLQERMRINSSGNIGINRTNQEFTLDVNGDIAFPRTSKLQFTGGVAGDRQRSYLTGDPNNNVFVYVPNGLSTTFTYTNNVLIGTSTDNGNRLNVSGSIYSNTNLTIENTTNGIVQQQIVNNSVNAQGSGLWRTYFRTILATGTGTKLNIPFNSQGNLNIVTLARVTICSADVNNSFGNTAQFMFSVGSLTALSNLQILSSGGGYSSATTSGMNVVVTLSSFQAAYVLIEYITPIPSYSIDLANITLTS